MKKIGFKLKLFLGIILSLCIIFTGTLFYISSKISPAEIKKVVLENLTKQFPNCNVALGDLNFSLGFSFKFDAKNFSMSLKNHEKDGELIKVDVAQIAIPIWAIITGGGSIEVNVNNPEMYYLVYNKDENNWKTALAGAAKSEDVKPIAEADNKGPKENAPEAGNDANKVKLMNFFAKSNVNIKFTDIHLNTKLADGTNSKIILSRFLVKNLNLKTPTAFELASKIEAKLKTGDQLALNGLIIGHVNINEIILGKDVDCSFRVSLEDIAFSKFKEKLPNVTSDIKLNIKKEDGAILVNTSTELFNMGNIKADTYVKNGKIDVKGIDIKIIIKEALRIFAPQFNQLKVGDSKLSLMGEVSMKDGQIMPQIEFNFAPGVNITVDETLTILSEFNGRLNGKNVDFNSNNKLLKGAVDIHVNTEFDVNKPVTNPEELSPVYVEFVASDLVIDESMIQKKIYAAKPSTSASEKESLSTTSTVASNSASAQLSPEEQKVLVEKENSPSPKFPTVKAKIRLSKIHLGREELSSNSTILVQKNKLTSDDLSFTFARGKGAVSFLVTLLEKSQKTVQWDFNLTNLNIEGLRPFMPPQIDVVTGVFSGKTKGNAHIGTRPDQLKYDINMDLSAINGEIKGIKIGEMIKNVAENFSFLKGKTSGLNQKIDNNFEVFLFKGNSRQDKITIDQLKFIGINKSVEINGKGAVYPSITKKEGQVDLDVLDNTGIVSDQLEKNAGTRVLPIRLKGMGFTLMPDYMYTTTILAKGALKKTQDKVEAKVKEKGKEKVKEEADKVIDKVLKDDGQKQQVKKLLKGLF